MRSAWTVAGLIALSAALITAPAPVGLPEAGKRVIAVAVLAIGLWCTEALPAGVTSLVLVVALVLSGGGTRICRGACRFAVLERRGRAVAYALTLEEDL